MVWNGKTLLKEMKKDLNKWKDILCSQTGRLKYWYNCGSPSITLYFQSNPPCPTSRCLYFLAEIGSFILYVLWICILSRVAKTLWEKSKLWNLTLLIFKTYSRTTKASQVTQWSRMQETLVWSLSWGRSTGVGNDNLLQYSCLENSMTRGTWRATVHGGHKESNTTEWLSTQIYMHAHTHTQSYTN